jgi:myo-inositol-1(or 4)-monophosphatase
MDKHQESEELQFAIDLARQAGQVLLQHFGTSLTRTIKTHQQDFATEADIAAEELIISAIRKKFPEDAILAEESGQHAGSSGYTWIIDPLDGTWNFAEGKEFWGVMIARAHGDKVQLAVVFNPYKNMLAFAEQGNGTFLNGRRAIIHPVAWDAIKPLLNNLPLTSSLDRARVFRERMKAQGLQISIRSAAGKALEALSSSRDLQIQVSLPPGKIWDHAPTSLLFAEAGLRVTNFEGNPYVWHRDENGFLAAVPDVHQKVLSLLKATP